MLQLDARNRDRMTSALVVAMIHALLGWALLTGLGFEIGIPQVDQLKLFDVHEDLPPPAVPAEPEKVVESHREKPKDPEGAAAPANLRNTPSEIVAPKPEILIKVPPPVIAAPVPGQGSAEAAGAAEVPGPGTGRGGQGTGLGSGGGGGGRGSPARWVSGSIRPSDYPRSAFDAGIGGTVHIRFTVAPSGRVSDCTVTRSSGSAELDRTTCRLIVARLRYRPARDGAGRPIASVVTGDHEWHVTRRPTRVEEEPDEEL
jgi:protein TonB